MAKSLEGGGGGEVRFRLLGHLRILLFIAGEPQKLEKQRSISAIQTCSYHSGFPKRMGKENGPLVFIVVAALFMPIRLSSLQSSFVSGPAPEIAKALYCIASRYSLFFSVTLQFLHAS